MYVASSVFRYNIALVLVCFSSCDGGETTLDKHEVEKSRR